MNQSCDFVADKNTQTMLPHVLFYLGNTKSHAVYPKYQLLCVQQKLFCLIYVWENHSNNSWKIALAQSLQASNQHIYQRQPTRISLIYIWLGVALRVGDDSSSHLTQMGAVDHSNSILSQWRQQIIAEHWNLNFLLWLWRLEGHQIQIYRQSHSTCNKKSAFFLFFLTMPLDNWCLWYNDVYDINNFII